MMNSKLHITEDELELIDQYLNNQLPAADKIAFEERLAGDAAWKQKLEEIKLISLGIQEAALRELLPTFNNVNKQLHTRVISMNRIKKMAAAAAVIGLISVVGLMFFKTPAEDKLYASYYQPDPGLATEMGIADNYEFSRAMVDYKTAHYTEALVRWEKLLVANTANDTLNYFVGCASLANNDLSKAVSSFTNVTQNKQSVFEKEAYWYLGLALLKQKNKTAAIAAISQSDHPGKDALLAKLKGRI
ncbi:hypothetical protein BH11BAC3_BH11BAC3_34920 [soil metagenome]